MIIQRPTFIQVPSHSLDLVDLTAGVLDSPEPMFFTAPSTPATEEPVVELLHADSPLDEAFPSALDIPKELDLDDNGLTALEKIYLFSRSNSPFHRVFIAHALPNLLNSVSPEEAVEYVLPLLKVLALDEEESVKEAFVVELVPIIWWFFSHCQLIQFDVDPHPQPQGPPTICVDAFTPILVTLLLSRNKYVHGPARSAVVDILQRMRRADQLEDHNQPETIEHIPEFDLTPGLFGRQERSWLESEILSQVVIGMGRLDIDPDDGDEDDDDDDDIFLTPSVFDEAQFQIPSPASPSPTGSESNYNPYFSLLPSSTSLFLSSSGSEQSTPSSTTGTTASESSSESSPGTFESPGSTSSPSKHFSSSSSETVITRQDPEPVHTNPSRQESSSHNSFLAQALHGRGSMPLVLPPNSKQKSSLETTLPTADPSIESADLTLNAVNQNAPFPNAAAVLPDSRRDTQNMIQVDLPVVISPISETVEEDEQSEKEQAAVGRLSSMSLMASVVANAFLDDPIKKSFVHEVERVAHDPVYWVRCEACFALGALAKVVPDELVSLSLVPLLRRLLEDIVPAVRCSTLFALPAILSRLPHKKRRKLALDIMLPMSMDDSPEVRQRILEALGEVLYTFHPPESTYVGDERTGPPEELIQMFLGRSIPENTLGSQQQLHNLELFYNDPSRPLICAFNFPAVTLVLGQSRWTSDLRASYLSLAASNLTSVKRTLAASVGELARIVGRDSAGQDLLPVWLSAIASPEEEVPLKALECFAIFYQVLGVENRVSALSGLLRSCETAILKSWRERELVAQSLKGVVELAQSSKEILELVRGLLRCVLWDKVSAVREAGVEALPPIWMASMEHELLLEGLRADVAALAKSAAFRPRMTFVACQQKLILPGVDGKSVLQPDDAFWTSISLAVNDDILDVRIGVARLVGLAYNLLLRRGIPIPTTLLVLCRRLSQDKSREVQSYVPDLSSSEPHDPRWDSLGRPVSTFSRPPVYQSVSSLASTPTFDVNKIARESP